MTQPTHIEETIKRFEEWYVANTGFESVPRLEKITNFLRTTLTQLVERDLEWAKSREREVEGIDRTYGDTDHEADAVNFGYNECLTDFINHKREEI